MPPSRKDIETVQDLLREMVSIRSIQNISEALGISRASFSHWLVTSDANLNRLRPVHIERIANLAIKIGIPESSLPDAALETLVEARVPIFLCHASDDKERVRSIDRHLRSRGLNSWLDESQLMPGQIWRYEIEEVIRKSGAVVVILSKRSVDKTGFVQKEIRAALDAADERPDGTLFLIPARLEECKIPARLRHIQWIDLFAGDGMERLVRSLNNQRMSRLS